MKNMNISHIYSKPAMIPAQKHSANYNLNNYFLCLQTWL